MEPDKEQDSPQSDTNRTRSERGTGQAVVIPKARKNASDERFRSPAAVLFRAMKARGETGLSWRECWMALDEAGIEEQVGPCIVWMRSKGVAVSAAYRDGETVFVWEEPVAPSGE